MSFRDQDQPYIQAQAEHGEPMRRLVRGYESGPDRQRYLLQEMDIEPWRSLKEFDRRRSLRTERGGDRMLKSDTPPFVR